MASLRPMARLVAPRAQLARARIAQFQPARFASSTQQQQPTEEASEELITQPGEDINMNGNYPDPSLTSALPLKRQFRDPYADWWDPQERRNYGEPIHEDNDILGIFTPEEYTHFKPGWGAVLLVRLHQYVGTGQQLMPMQGSFVASVFGLAYVVGKFYPDKVFILEVRRPTLTDLLQPSVTRHFEDGLEAELGGPKAVRARKSEDDWAPLDRS
ncbi:uncharacterized protein RCC_08129 [Ramularia collo-cygni]|uniref:Uncharacterized protein n=1 Tax=Ramularia collo-cygni TaxID=112498 RepID=A0A2D3V9X9_9PEZI|nr:uncharacterized protein RCC_08129 [Ramularia collo-cygni]CZT22260.1 uncharacterized protein RCC_08129 [Ramularia collo-cygni]